ncbi:MAG: hypothetical protein ACRDY6_16415 [Acidimicrobiia bacterium]
MVAIGGCAAGAAVLRFPFAFTGLVPDEGGYAYVAQQWARGARLYDTAWADRPQGLLVAYRVLLSIGAEPWTIRLGAVVCGVAITVLLGVIGWQLRGPVTGIAAAGIYAVVGVGPRITGFTFNGELVAALPAAAAIAAALAWRSSTRVTWLVVAGALASTAILVKQSSIEGLAVTTAIVVMSSTAWASRRRSLAVLFGAAAVPLAGSMLHGWSVGWSNYWSAVISARMGDRLDLASLVRRPGRFFATADEAWYDLGPLALLAIAGLILARREGDPVAIPVYWLIAAFVGFNLGALYWRHYYVQLVPPLALLGGIAVTYVPSRFYKRVAVGVVTLPVAVFLATLALLPTEHRERRIPHYRAFEYNRQIAAHLHARFAPGDSIYVLVSQADLYFLVDRPVRYPYLWGHPVVEIPGALQQLRDLLGSARRPEWLVVYTSPREVDPSGGLGRIVREHYERDAEMRSSRATIYQARDVGTSRVPHVVHDPPRGTGAALFGDEAANAWSRRCLAMPRVGSCCTAQLLPPGSPK